MANEGEHDYVSPIPVLMSSDGTYLLKGIPVHPVYVTLGVLHDDVRRQPGSWHVAAFLPPFSSKIARYAQRPRDGPSGTPRRKAELMHLSWRAILQGFIETTRTVKYLPWADGKKRRCRFFLAGYLGDQPEHDTLCAEQSQTCKICKCPRSEFAQFSVQHELRSSAETKVQVMTTYTQPYAVTVTRTAADQQQRDVRQELRSPIFVPCSDKTHSDHGEVRDWRHQYRRGVVADYERLRRSLRGVHMVYNSFWDVPGFDIFLQTFKDPMHAFEHGVCMVIIRCIIFVLQQLTILLGGAETLTSRFIARLKLLCDTRGKRHITLISFYDQSIIGCVENFAAGRNEQSMIDCSDVQKFLLLLPFVLFGLASPDVKYHLMSEQQRSAMSKMNNVIKTVNLWLRWHLTYMSSQMSCSQLEDFHSLGEMLSTQLLEVFPFSSSGHQAEGRNSIWCTEKFHSIVHAARNWKEVGNPRNISTQATESAHRYLREMGSSINRQPRFAKTLMGLCIENSAAYQLACDQDSFGEHFEFMWMFCSEQLSLQEMYGTALMNKMKINPRGQQFSERLGISIRKIQNLMEIWQLGSVATSGNVLHTQQLSCTSWTAGLSRDTENFLYHH